MKSVYNNYYIRVIYCRNVKHKGLIQISYLGFAAFINV